MKKIIISIVLSVFAVQSVFAAQVYTDYYLSFAKKTVGNFYPLHIKAETDSEIKSENGINIIIPRDQYLLWNNTDGITLTGSAVTNARVNGSAKLSYSSDYKVVSISVISDFAKNDELIISGLQVRAFGNTVPASFLGVDINGDMAADFYDVNQYKVTDDDTRSDRTAPYPVTNLKYTVNDAKTQVKLTWNNPPDYDVSSITVEKTLTRNGITKSAIDVSTGLMLTEYADTQVLPGDKIIYGVYANDSVNLGEKTVVTIDLSTPTGQTGTTTPVIPPTTVEPPKTTDKSETDTLKSLYNYYKVRYSIKCRVTSGSDCLWAKIDLIYAQKLIGKSDISATLSANDLRLIKLRLPFPEARYQTKCVQAATPDKTCVNLKESLKRAHYFID